MAICGLAFIGLSSPASASALYVNGPFDGGHGAGSISGGDATTNSFTLAGRSTLTGVNFGGWTELGNVVTSVDWAITSTPNIFPINGTAAVTSGVLHTNPKVYSVGIDSFSLPNITLAAGTYYLVLQNAVTTNGSGVGWDLDNGSSVAWNTYWGSTQNIPTAFGGSGSEYFELLGTPAPVPEWRTWLMMITGLGAAGVMLRRWRKSRHRLQSPV